MTYDLHPVNILHPGQRFMFAAAGSTINVCVICQRDLIVYSNLMTGKTRRLKLLGNEKTFWPLRYVKNLDGFFDKYYNDRKEIEEMPF